MNNLHSNPWNSAHTNVLDILTVDGETSLAPPYTSACSSRGKEASPGGTGGTGIVGHSPSWGQGHASSSSTSGMMNPAFASQIATNPRSVTVHFQPADTNVPATPVPMNQSVYGGVAPYGTAFASSLHQAPEPKPFCVPGVRPYLALYEDFWSLNNTWEVPHPVTADKVFKFLNSHVLTIARQSGSYTPVVKNTIDAFDTYRRDNSHLAAYSYPQEFLINPLGQPTTLRYDPRLQGLESLESCFIHQEQAYKTFVNMFRLHLSGVESGSARLVVDSVRLHGAIRQRTVLLFARWLTPLIAFSFVPQLLWANLTVDMLPCAGGNSGETPREDLHLRAFISFPSEDGGSNEFMYTARRHEFAEVCPVGAIGWYFFSEFHIAKHPRPDFAFFENTPTGEFFRPWQMFMLIPDNAFLHADLVHYTPAFNRGRTTTVGTRLSPNEYSVVEAESYNAGRGDLKPPSVLLKSVFPWIEQERKAYSQRLETQGPAMATDLTLGRFLDTLTTLRTVILQDAVVLAIKYPDCHIFRLPLFDCLEFRKYAEAARSILKQTLEPAATTGTRNGMNAEVVNDPQSTQSAVERAFPSPLPDVDAVFTLLGNENVDIDLLKGSLTAGVVGEKEATMTPLPSSLSPTKRSSQAGRRARTKNGQREKPRDIRPAGPFWENLTGIDTGL